MLALDRTSRRSPPPSPLLAATLLLLLLVPDARCVDQNNLLHANSKDGLHKSTHKDHVNNNNLATQKDAIGTGFKSDLDLESPVVVQDSDAGPVKLKMMDDLVPDEVTDQDKQSLKDDIVPVEAIAQDNLAVESSNSGSAVLVHTVAPPTQKQPTLCLCNPPCKASNTSAVVGASSDTPCSRWVTRKDCPCCILCARQEGESCEAPQDTCDEDFGLHCHPDTNTCLAEVSCSVDSQCADDQHCLWGACVDPCPLLRPCHTPAPIHADDAPSISPSAPRGGVCVVRGHRALCECPPGTTLTGHECVEHTSPTATNDESNSLLDDDDVLPKAKDSVVRLGVLQVTHNSSVLQLPSPAGGQLFYKPSSPVPEFSPQASKGRIEVLPLSGGGSNHTLRLEGLAPRTQYHLNWLGQDGTVAEGTLSTIDGCSQGGVSYAVGEQLTVGCHSRCICQAGGEEDCQPRCKGEYQVRGLAKPPQQEGCSPMADPSEPDCCVTYRCTGDLLITDDTASPLMPKLIIMQISHDSATLAWDDFRSGDQSAQYTAQYRKTTLSGGHTWMSEAVDRTTGPPTVTLKDLMPSTTYEVRVSILDDTTGEDTGDHTETITVTTHPGCMYLNTSYPVGSFTRGCEEACTCTLQGAVTCNERCTIPYFKRGKFKSDDLCSEQPAVADECCVLVVCQTRSGTSQEYDPCVNIVCGPNAHCVSETINLNGTSGGSTVTHTTDTGDSIIPMVLPSITHDVSPLGHCKCLPGFEGNPTNLETGCGSASRGVCHHHNSTYRAGEVFYDQCVSRCYCTHSGEIDCQPRCPSLPPLGDGCELVPDPADSCCSMHACPNTTTAGATVSPSKDGCVYGNSTYERHESFTDGCSFKCVCLGYGDVSCSPRCSPLRRASTDASESCQTLPDPVDACCTITVCDDHLDGPLHHHTLSEEHEENHTAIDHEMNMTTMSHDQMHELGVPHSHGDGTPLVHEHEAGEENMTVVESHDHFGGLTHIELHEMDVDHDHDMHGNPILKKMSKDDMEETTIMPGNDGVAHEHDGMTHTHEHDGMTHTHEHDGMTHTHKHDGMTHTHEHDGMTHTHEHDGMTHTHEHEGMTHAHEHDGMTHTHEHDGSTHTHEHDSMAHGQEHTIKVENATITEVSSDHHSTSSDDMSDLGRSEDVMSAAEETTSSNNDVMDKKSSVHPPMLVFPSDHELRILHTTGLNESTIEVQVEVTESVVDRLLSSADLPLVVSTQQASSINEDDAPPAWHDHVVPVKDITISDLTTLSFIIADLMPGQQYNVRVAFQNSSSPIVTSYLPNASSSVESGPPTPEEEVVGRASSLAGADVFAASCTMKGTTYNPGETFFDGCDQYCMCDEQMQIQCYPIDCPDTVGLDLAEPNCLDWDLDPDFVPSPPRCCPVLKCTRRSDCHYMGQHFTNYEELPRDLTGCSQRCVCELGNVTCIDACEHHVDSSAPPPAHLPCPPEEAILVTLPGENCCLEWQCAKTHQSDIGGVFSSHLPSFPHHPSFPHFPDMTHTGGHHPHDPSFVHPNFPHSPPGAVPIHHFGTLHGLLEPSSPESGIGEPVVTSQSQDSVSVFFSTPSVYKGLTGNLYVRYTTDSTEPTSSWMVSSVLPDGALVSRSDWDHKIEGLLPDTQYTMQVVLMISLTNAEVTSPLFSASTLEPQYLAPPSSLDAALTVTEVRQTSALVSWRALTPDELRHIDGAQVKYKDVTKQLMEFSPMLHHSTRQYLLENLQPSTTYMVDVTFLPIDQQDTTIMNTQSRNFTTLPREQDPYNFTLSITLGEVTPYSAQIIYSGVPQPEEKFVNVYQLEYLREDDRHHERVYKSPKQEYNNFQDLSPNVPGGGVDQDVILLEDLRPDQTYQAWLLAYLSNGGFIKSTVIDLRTLPATELPQRSELESTSNTAGASNYYSAMIALAIIAAIMCIAFLALVFLFVRRQTHAQATARINTDGAANKNVATAAYDNPSYKTYDMEMNGMKSTNGASVAAEEP